MMQQVEQLKEDISCKENELTSRELMHRKLQSEKQSLKADSQLWKENYKKAKKVIDTLQEEISEIKYTLNMNNSKVQRFRKEIDHVMNERDILNSQLNHCKNDLALLNEKLRVLQVTLDKGKALYFQHLDDIHLLKIEVKQLRSEKLKLAKVVNNSTDFRSEIFHLERDLTKERLKCKALEEELQTPLNIHRWRKLEGSDPVKLELLQKIKILQKRLLKGTTSSKKLENKLLNCNKKYEALKKELSRQPGPDIIQQLTKTQSALRENSTNKRCLLGQIAAYKSEIADLNLSIQHVKNELTEVKKLYFEQKSKAERYKRHLDELKKERMNHENEELTTILPLLKAKISNGYDRLNSNNGADSNTSKVNNDICNAITRQSF
ncbi:cilia- and flagella-associated protein 58-like isoform X1 [Lycorma delicatula]|uniref:cilia- and flagella-associated protein 58-like isoform X1 n=1 Tax=Lycorma delicatula TaxID=130591 RepID=UPI003F50D6BD